MSCPPEAEVRREGYTLDGPTSEDEDLAYLVDQMVSHTDPHWWGEAMLRQAHARSLRMDKFLLMLAAAIKAEIKTRKRDERYLSVVRDNEVTHRGGDGG